MATKKSAKRRTSTRKGSPKPPPGPHILQGPDFYYAVAMGTKKVQVAGQGEPVDYTELAVVGQQSGKICTPIDPATPMLTTAAGQDVPADNKCGFTKPVKMYPGNKLLGTVTY